jgi:hypothetical protein
MFMILAMFDIKLHHHNNILTGVGCYCHNFLFENSVNDYRIAMNWLYLDNNNEQIQESV